MRTGLFLCLTLLCAAPALADDAAADRQACLLHDSAKPAQNAQVCDRLLQAPGLTSEGRAELLVAKARHLFHTGSIPESDAVWQLFIDQNSANAELWTAYGDNQFWLERFDSAKAQFEKALALDPASIHAAAEHARVLQEQHLSAEALDEAKALAAKNPGNREALLLRGEMLRTNNRWADAIETYDTVLKAEPAQLVALYWRAVSRTETGDNAGAETDITQFLAQPNCRDIDPFCLAGAFATRAQAREGLGRLPEALADMDSVVSRLKEIYGPASEIWPPGPRHLMEIRADLERKVGKPEDAAAHVIELARKDGVDGALRLQLKLRHGGYRSLKITGQLDMETIDAARNCAATPDCKVLQSL